MQTTQLCSEAHAGQVQLFITGYAALLQLDPADTVRILLPHQFWELMREQP